MFTIPEKIEVEVGLSMFGSIFNTRQRRKDVLDNIPQTIEESYERDKKSLEKDWNAVLGDFTKSMGFKDENHDTREDI